jgi:hypothetical protein
LSMPSTQRSRFAADAIACPKRATSEVRDWGSRLGVLQNGPSSRYDEAIVSLGLMVRLMNLNLKVVPGILSFSTTSKPKSIEIP